MNRRRRRRRRVLRGYYASAAAMDGGFFLIMTAMPFKVLALGGGAVELGLVPAIGAIAYVIVRARWPVTGATAPAARGCASPAASRSSPARCSPTARRRWPRCSACSC